MNVSGKARMNLTRMRKMVALKSKKLMKLKRMRWNVPQYVSFTLAACSFVSFLSFFFNQETHGTLCLSRVLIFRQSNLLFLLHPLLEEPIWLQIIWPQILSSFTWQSHFANFSAAPCIFIIVFAVKAYLFAYYTFHAACSIQAWTLGWYGDTPSPKKEKVSWLC